MSWLVQNSDISGIVDIPKSKSLTIRAIIVASLTDGVSIIKNYLVSDDTEAVIETMLKAGISIEKQGNDLKIKGNTFQKTNEVFHVRSSATALRFLIPIFLVKFNSFKITANDDLLRRPLDAFLTFFDKYKIKYQFIDNVYHIKGKLEPGQYEIEGHVSSQYASGLLLALSTYEKPSNIVIMNRLVSEPYLQMTIDIIKLFSENEIKFIGNLIIIKEGNKYLPKTYFVEGDYSQAAYYLVLSALNKKIKIKGLSKESLQGDQKVLDFLEKMGVSCYWKEKTLLTDIKSFNEAEINLIDNPDLFPPLAVLAAFIPVKTKFINIQNLRFKESDRINAMIQNFAKLGIEYQLGEDFIVIKGTKPNGKKVLDGFNDHRIIMALTILTLISKDDYLIINTQEIVKTYPQFFEDIKLLGGKISMKKIEDLRQDIINIDKQMIELFKKRTHSIMLISDVKKDLNMPIIDSEYEKKQIKIHLDLLGDKSIESQYKEFYSKILDISYQIQKGVPKMALIGKGLTHSISPKLHHIIGRLNDFKYDYELMEINDEKELVEALNLIRTHDYKAYNVTMPYKRMVIKHLDVLTNKAHFSGVVNLVYLKNGLLIGDNVDYDGIAYSFEQMDINLSKYPIYILGTGATARTTATVLDNQGIEYTFVTRNKDTITDLINVIDYQDLKAVKDHIIINTTPVGMYPNEDMPISIEEVRKAVYIFDVIYNPNPTKIVKYAKAGLTGLDMLVSQGIAGYNQVFDKNVIISKKMVEAIKKELNE